MPILGVHFTKMDGGTLNPQENREERNHKGDRHLGICSDQARHKKHICFSDADSAVNI